MTAERGKKDVVALAVLAMRYSQVNRDVYSGLIEKLTGKKLTTWHDAATWLEGQPDIKAHESYRVIKLLMFARMDPKFLQFLGGARSDPDKMKIRLEEVTWGGVTVDGIPSLDNPKLIDAAEAEYMLDTDEVFGVEINGDVRAYPLRIMGWHEMFNEVIGGVPVALAYCTLCGSGILYETQLDDFKNPLVFGSSGFLYRSNKLMFDRTTLSLWNQFTGEPVAGPLVDAGIKLKVRPVAITTWGKWKLQHPKTKVLSLDTGHFRDYESGAVYNEYFSSPDLMFPVIVKDETTVKRKDYIFGLRDTGGVRAWPLHAFKDGKVLNDAVGLKNVVLIGEESSRTARAYYRQDKEFHAGTDALTLRGPGGAWKITEAVLLGPNGERLGHAPGAISYWFPWENYYGRRTTLYGRD